MMTANSARDGWRSRFAYSSTSALSTRRTSIKATCDFEQRGDLRLSSRTNGGCSTFNCRQAVNKIDAIMFDNYQGNPLLL
jgi:hypothetical protein